MTETKIKKAQPKGYCKDCRWASELPEGAQLPPELLESFPIYCSALPMKYQFVPIQGRVQHVHPNQSMNIQVVPEQNLKQEGNFCSLFEPRDPSKDGTGLLGSRQEGA